MEKHMEQQPRNIVPSEMSVEQINIRLTLIQSRNVSVMVMLQQK